MPVTGITDTNSAGRALIAKLTIMFILLNGQFVSEEQAVVPVTDRSFLYGHGVFETIPVYNGKPFRWAQHLERLAGGADVLATQPAFAPQELRTLGGEWVL